MGYYHVSGSPLVSQLSDLQFHRSDDKVILQAAQASVDAKLAAKVTAVASEQALGL